MKEFKSISLHEKSKEARIVIKGSIFLGNIYYIQNEEQAKKYILEVKKKHRTATHNCYAYITGNVKRSSDDGEPAKTAGIPMLSVLEKNGLNNIIVIVTRYFGGTLLGTGGLVKAYTDTTKEVIEVNQIVKYIKGIKISMILEYDKIEKTKRFINNFRHRIIEEKYDEIITLKTVVDIEKKNEVMQYSKAENTKIDIEEDDEAIYIEEE